MLAVTLSIFLAALGGEDVGVSQATAPLRLRFVPGRTLVYRISEEHTIADRAEGAPPIKTSSMQNVRIRALEAGDISAILTVRLESIEWTVNGPGEPIRFDSSQKPKRNEPAELKSMREVIGRDIQVALRSNGKIDTISDGMKTDENSPGVAWARRTVTLLTSWLPKEETVGAEGWNRNEELEVGIARLSRESQLRVTQSDGRRFLVVSKSKLKSLPSEGVVQDGFQTLAHIAASDPATATIRYDSLVGWVDRLESRSSFEMLIERRIVGTDELPLVSAQRLSARAVAELIAVDPPNLAN